MGSQLTIESPNFDRIRKNDGVAIENAIRLLWFVANNAADVERRDIQLARNSINLATLTVAPTVAQHNLNARGAGIVLVNTSTAFDLTGVRNGVQGALLILANLGSATMTAKHESASSDAANRITLAAAVDKAVATNKFLLLEYLNARWREMSLA